MTRHVDTAGLKQEYSVKLDRILGFDRLVAV